MSQKNTDAALRVLNTAFYDTSALSSVRLGMASRIMSASALVPQWVYRAVIWMSVWPSTAMRSSSLAPDSATLVAVQWRAEWILTYGRPAAWRAFLQRRFSCLFVFN